MKKGKRGNKVSRRIRPTKAWYNLGESLYSRKVGFMRSAQK